MGTLSLQPPCSPPAQPGATSITPSQTRPCTVCRGLVPLCLCAHKLPSLLLLEGGKEVTRCLEHPPARTERGEGGEGARTRGRSHGSHPARLPHHTAPEKAAANTSSSVLLGISLWLKNS